jgi:hypothetical protein
MTQRTADKLNILLIAGVTGLAAWSYLNSTPGTSTWVNTVSVTGIIAGLIGLAVTAVGATVRAHRT